MQLGASSKAPPTAARAAPPARRTAAVRAVASPGSCDGGDAHDDFGMFTLECKGCRRETRYLRISARPFLARRRRTVADLTLEALAALDCNATGREALFWFRRGWWKAFPDEMVAGLFDEGDILLFRL